MVMALGVRVKRPFVMPGAFLMVKDEVPSLVVGAPNYKPTVKLVGWHVYFFRGLDLAMINLVQPLG